MVGQNIGKYRVLDRIGRGGMGTVYKAIDETLHREVAIKVLNAELNDPAVGRRFRAEAVTVARLNHPGIATIFELFQHDGEWLMVMEFLRGETLEGLVVRKGALPPEQAADVCMQALAALAHAHSLGVVHRDLKPANVMVTESGAVKIMDFGIARVVGTEHLTSAGFMMGTPAYMAPEQVLGKDIDARADIYAMGVVLFYLLTTKLPFLGNTPFEMAQSRLRDDPTPVRAVRPDLPAWFDQVLSSALRREPEQRYQTAPMFREALRRGLENLPQDTEITEAVPAELVVTAVPGSMRLPAPPAVSPETKHEPSVVAVPLPVAPAPSVAPDSPAGKSAPDVVPSKSERRPAAALALVAALVLGVALGGWWWMRSRSTQIADSSPPQITETAQAPQPPPAEPALNTPAPQAPAPAAPGPSPLSTSAAPPVAASPPEGRPGAATAPPPAGVGSPTPASSSARAGGRATTTPDPPLGFKDLRVLVVAGKKAEERNVVLNFGAGRVTAADERDGSTLSSMAYGDISYAMYVRAKDPKWSVVLAAPPADVDLPGGLFRSSRHWLSLQSRSTYMIVRLNDNDWRQVLAAVTARTGIAVEQPAGSR